MQKKRIKVAFLFGGKSAEHEISILTALQAYLALDPQVFEAFPVYISQTGKWYTGDALFEKKNYPDFNPKKLQLTRVVCLPEPGIDGFLCFEAEGKINLQKKLEVDVCLLCFHGQKGEDGCIQGLLELAEIPYTGASFASSAAAMNKSFCKAILAHFGIPVLPWVTVSKKELKNRFNETVEFILNHLRDFPLFIKPCRLGSSIGISKASDLKSLKAGLAKAIIYDKEVIIEPCLTEMMEINVSVLNGEPSVVEVPIATSDSLSYEDKYLRGGKTSQGMASLQRIIDPGDLDPAIKKSVQDLSLKAFSILDSSGVVRFDYLLDLKSGKLFFNELNPIPGSLAFYLWEKTNPKKLYTDILSQIIEEALNNKKESLTLKQNLDFKAIS